jgi:two-component sensor histidine kinase
MTDRRTTDRWLAAGVVAVLLLCLAFIVASALTLRDRQRELAEMSLERTQQMLRLRIDGMFHELAEDLREEAAALESTRYETDALVDRWKPLMDSHWPIMTIRLADEKGNEIEYARNDEDRYVRLTWEGSKEKGPAHFDPFNGDSISVPISDTTAGTIYDPRQRIWFGKALENTFDEPTWNIKYFKEGPPLLQVSLLIRSKYEAEPFRIMEMDVDLGRSAWIDTYETGLKPFGMLLLDGTGRILELPGSDKDPLVAEAELEAASYWAANTNSQPFTIGLNGSDYHVSVRPYPLNGLTLYTLVLVDVEIIADWSWTEKRNIWILSIFVLLLSVLLTWIYLRKRKENARLRRQARRSRTQERKLAKALGEREVLNREVHHRVKNNLQVVSSLLNLQATRLEDGAVRNEFIRGKKRIDLIALVHHKLYGMKDLRNVDIAVFFRELVRSLAEMYQPQSRTVSFEVDTEGLQVDQDTAIELGIILCELVSNSYQHAFPYATGGHVDVIVRPVENELYRLIVKDNGQGLPENYTLGPGKLGLEIVEALAEQMDGSFHVRQNGGVTFEVLFRMIQPYADPLEA